MEIDYVLKEGYFAVPQYERVAKLREVVPAWLAELESDQALIIGILPIGYGWSKVELIIIGPHMADLFAAWLEKNKEAITGPHLMLPKLQGFFQLVSIRPEYDPAKHGFPTTASESLRATLERFAAQLAEQAVT